MILQSLSLLKHSTTTDSMCFSQRQVNLSPLLGKSTLAFAFLQFYLQPTTFHLFPNGPSGSHSFSKILTVVALGLGGLAFPLLPVLLPLFISDFSFCSLTGKNKYRQCQVCYQSMHKYCLHINHRDKKQNKGRRAGSLISIPLARLFSVLKVSDHSLVYTTFLTSK